MPGKLNELQIIQRPRIFKSPDASDIGLGPQKFDRSAETNGPGSVATATFYQGASSALMHNTVSEKWYYVEGHDFYMWLCPEDKSIHEGKFYKVSAGSKIEVPPRTKFQIYNPSEEVVQVLLVVNKCWPQDDSVQFEIAFPEGPWRRQTVCHYKPDVVTQEYMDHIYFNDPIAQQSSTGFEYIQKILASIDEDVEQYAIVGDSWYVYSKETPLFTPMPIPAGARIIAALNDIELDEMSQHIRALDNYIATQLVLGKIEYCIGLMHYQNNQFPQAAYYFARARVLGDKNAAFYEGLMAEKGEGCNANFQKAVTCYQWAATLGHFGAFRYDGKLHSELENENEKRLHLIADKQAHYPESKASV